ncbi:MAG: MMPL family transporter [Nitrospinae bacterium]|nr:MMPL family transporter [Nitrospinota bacterium]
MNFRRAITVYCADRPWRTIIATSVLCFALIAQIPKIKIDTDPENMLSESEPVRTFHNQVKKEFSLHDMIVMGVVNDRDPDGVFNPRTLKNIYLLTQKIERIDGVIPIDLLAPSKVDDIRQAGLGAVRFEWLMPEPPETRAEALRVRDRALDNPVLKGALVSEDGKALCLYIPIRSKDLSYKIASRLRDETRALAGDEEYHITGLPVAEDTFGVEMFKEMAVSAPMAGVLIFLIMLFFFRSFALVAAPMVLATLTALATMGLLIGTGHTVHIMSSMIPIFLMPIAVVDSVHILSEFFDRYPAVQNRKETIVKVMDELFDSMLYTSLTSAAGFGSLAMTPIPPVTVFGVFVAFGIMLAWVLTITFVPAFVMVIGESSFQRLASRKLPEGKSPVLDKGLRALGFWTHDKAKYSLIASAIVMVLSVVGIHAIHINDNPVKWFEEQHPIRVADRVLNRHFAGTYMAYLVLQENPGEADFKKSLAETRKDLERRVDELAPDVPALPEIRPRLSEILEAEAGTQLQKGDWSILALLKTMERKTAGEAEKNPGGLGRAWDETNIFFNERKVALQTFKRPDVLRYLESLETHLQASGRVGKSTSLVDVVKKVHYELMEGNKEYDAVPQTAAGVAQTLLSYQNSHDPDDLWHLTTPDYEKASLWIQLKSGDNKDMESVAELTGRYFRDNPPPAPLSFQWAGLAYLNVVWQDKMVWGMLRSLMGSFVMVFVMMAFLFRSALWGLLCMVPLTATIALIYGLIGFAGKDYDMPIAVLSAMTLGMSVDFAIHFLQRSRTVYARSGNDWKTAQGEMFEEPARAISKNILVIALGFTPLLVAPLVPYQTVGFFLASIMAVSGAATLVLLPALMRYLEPWLFRKFALKKGDRP